jgi:diguanylate cyclase (GGDEF)-like protein
VVTFLAIGAIVIVLFQEILPAGSLGRWRQPIEALGALAFLTTLLVLTGGQNSAFFFGYILLLGAGSLWASGRAAATLAVATGMAYLIGVLVPFNALPTGPADLTRIAVNLIALGLVAYVSAVVGREQRRAREEALRLSRFDSLTGLHSRDFFTAEMEQEILRAARSGRTFALLMFDLDGLKAANDRFGHASGDALLRAVADTLRGDIRITDIAARWGGDEFVILLLETDLAGAMLVADKVRIDVGRLALPHDGFVVRTSASIGLVTYPDDGKSSTELMRRADLAMYEAKRRGRDQVVRFAREPKQEAAAPNGTKPFGLVGVPIATTSNGTGAPLSGLPAPAVVVTPEGVSVPRGAPNAPMAQAESQVPSAWVGRAPWESPGG